MAEEKKASGFESTVLSTIDAYVERLIAGMVDEGSKLGPIARMIEGMNPAMRLAIFDGLPGAVGLAVSRIPLNTFGTPERTEFFKDMLREVSKKVAEAVNKGAKSAEEIGAAIGQAEKAVNERMFALDNQLHLFHMPDCAQLKTMFSPKGGHAQVPYEAAIKQGLKACPHCFVRIQEALSATPKGEAEKATRKNPSPLDIIGQMDKKDQAAFMKWFKGGDAEARKNRMDAMHELDSMEEFRGLMALPTAIRDEALGLLKNRNAKYAVKDFLAALGSAVKAGYAKVVERLVAGWRAYLRFNASLEPSVAERRQRVAALRADRKKPVKWSLLEMLKPF